MDEVILVVPREKLFASETLYFHGVVQEERKVALLAANIAGNYSTMRRGEAEENAAYKQPIPYCVIRRGSDIFLYRRLGGGGEARLFDKLSIGAGGHMNDNPELTTFEAVLQDNLSRELEEELEITASTREFTTVGFINDDENEVGKVHIGLLVILDIDADGEVNVRETEQLEGQWVTSAQLREEPIYSKLESWSQIVTQVLG
jgi:predicted NUDIX family phosphoesterase